MKKRFYPTFVLALAFGLIATSCTGTVEPPVEVVNHTVTFDYNTPDGGPGVTIKTVEHGKVVSTPATPTRDGFDFVHWTLGLESGSVAFQFSTPIIADITLYAKWNLAHHQTFDVVFDQNHPLGVLSEVFVNDGDLVSAPAEDPVRFEAEFAGWFAGPSFGAAPFDFSQPIRENKIVFAQWILSDSPADDWSAEEKDTMNLVLEEVLPFFSFGNFYSVETQLIEGGNHVVIKSLGGSLYAPSVVAASFPVADGWLAVANASTAFSLVKVASNNDDDDIFVDAVYDALTKEMTVFSWRKTTRSNWLDVVNFLETVYTDGLNLVEPTLGMFDRFTTGSAGSSVEKWVSYIPRDNSLEGIVDAFYAVVDTFYYNVNWTYVEYTALENFFSLTNGNQVLEYAYHFINYDRGVQVAVNFEATYSGSTLVSINGVGAYYCPYRKVTDAEFQNKFAEADVQFRRFAVPAKTDFANVIPESTNPMITGVTYDYNYFGTNPAANGQFGVLAQYPGMDANLAFTWAAVDLFDAGWRNIASNSLSWTGSDYVFVHPDYKHYITILSYGGNIEYWASAGTYHFTQFGAHSQTFVPEAISNLNGINIPNIKLTGTLANPGFCYIYNYVNQFSFFGKNMASASYVYSVSPASGALGIAAMGAQFESVGYSYSATLSTLYGTVVYSDGESHVLISNYSATSGINMTFGDGSTGTCAIINYTVIKPLAIGTFAEVKAAVVADYESKFVTAGEGAPEFAIAGLVQPAATIVAATATWIAHEYSADLDAYTLLARPSAQTNTTTQRTNRNNYLTATGSTSIDGNATSTTGTAMRTGSFPAAGYRIGARYPDASAFPAQQFPGVNGTFIDLNLFHIYVGPYHA